MKRISIFIVVLTATLACQAQINFPALYSNNSNLAASRYMPAVIGMDRAGVQVDIVNAYIYVGNSTWSYKQGDEFLTNTNPNNQTVEDILAELRNQNYVSAGVIVQPLNFSFKVNEDLAFGVGWAERMEARFSFNDDFFKMIWRGNAPFAGQDVELGPSDWNVMYLREFSINGAYHALSSDDLSLWVAARPKYFQGIASLYAPDNNFTVYTAPNGEYIDLTYDNRINVALDTSKPLRPTGSGFGFDLGGNIQIGERLHGSLNLIDIGSVKFTKEVSNASANQKVHYVGVELDDIFTEVVVRDSALVDELTGYTETNEAYSHPLPTKLILQGAYRIPGTTKGDKDYYKSSFFFTIVQGLSKHSSFGMLNILSLGAATDFGGVFNVGGNLNMINFNQFQLGAFLSARLAVVRIGVGTSNLFPLALRSGPSSDVNFTLGLSF